MLEKTGGKSGDWRRRLSGTGLRSSCSPIARRAATRPDACIPVDSRETLGDAFTIADERVIADDPAALQAALIELCDSRRRLRF